MVCSAEFAFVFTLPLDVTSGLGVWYKYTDVLHSYDCALFYHGLFDALDGDGYFVMRQLNRFDLFLTVSLDQQASKVMLEGYQL